MRTIVCVSTLLVGMSSFAAGQENPGLKALIDASSDVAVVDVLKTTPRLATEGARDTVELRVVRPIKGGLTAEKTFGVYYHLLRGDRAVEPPKFEKGRRYLVFLKATTVRDLKGNRTVEYKLADQWLSVQPWHPALERDANTAFRPAPQLFLGFGVQQERDANGN